MTIDAAPKRAAAARWAERLAARLPGGPRGGASRTAAAPAILRGEAIGPLPKGLSGWAARVADRASNACDRRDLPFSADLEAALAALRQSAGAQQADPEAAFTPTPLVDLHADTLLWGVNPWLRRSSGHVDLPRLFDARVGLQVFGGPTWTPLPMKNREQALCVSCESIDQSDALFPSQWLDRARRGKAALRRRRAHRLAERFTQMIAADVDGRLRPVFRSDDLTGLRTPLEPTSRRAPVGVMLSLEGVHWVEPEDAPAAIRDEVAALRAAGYRMIAPTHRFANGLGGSSEDCSGRMGLTKAGRVLVQSCFEAGVAVDLAHASPAMIREAAGLALTCEGGPRPVLVSHGGVRGAHRAARNLRDADIRAVASTGGVIGVGVWLEAIGFDARAPFEAKVERIVDAFAAALDALEQPDFVEEMQDRYGCYDAYEHLAIGSDFDGATHTPFDVTGLSWLLTAMMERARPTGQALLPPDKLPLVMGGNALRALSASISRP